MNRWLATSCIGLVFLSSCAQKGSEPAAGTNSLANPNTATIAEKADRPSNPAPTGTPRPAEIIATVNDQPITIEQLQRPVIDAYGLQFLLHLTQLELCKQKAAEIGVTVTPEDIAAEHQLTLDQMFKDAVTLDAKMSPEEQAKFRQAEYDRLLNQFLLTQRISEPEFDLAMQSGAYLRKLAEQGMQDKITEEHLQQGFNIIYGEKVRVRHIQLTNMREVAEAQRRLKDGEAFEKVAAEMSTDAASRQAGGEIRAFSRAEPSWPEQFKETSFELEEPGEISEPVHAGDTIHLIKLIAKIPPNKAVNYETHKEFVREELFKGLMIVRIRQLREALALEARGALKIQDPVLRKQYIGRLERAAGGAGRDPNVVRKEIEADYRNPATQPADTMDDQSAPPVPSEGRRPPATMPGQ